MLLVTRLQEIVVDLMSTHNTAQNVNVLNEKGKARIQQHHLEQKKEDQIFNAYYLKHCKLAHTTHSKNNMRQQCWGDCGLWILKDEIEKYSPFPLELG